MIKSLSTGKAKIGLRNRRSIHFKLLFVLVAISVSIFISCGFRNTPFEYIDKEPFETEYGVTGMVKEKQSAYKSAYAAYNITGACVCILSPIPLFIGVFMENEFLMVILLSVTMLLAGVGAAIFIVAGVRWASMQKLLKEGEFAPQEKRKGRIRETVSSACWLTATAVYLGWSFINDFTFLSVIRSSSVTIPHKSGECASYNLQFLRTRSWLAFA